jgi:hypothetical protein
MDMHKQIALALLAGLIGLSLASAIRDSRQRDVTAAISSVASAEIMKAGPGSFMLAGEFPWQQKGR